MRKSVALLASVTLAVLLAGGAAWAAAGDLDPTFGDGGRVVGPAPGDPAPYEDCPVDDLSVVQPGGKIVAFSDCGVLARYNPDGSLDETFGGDGSVVPKQFDADPRRTGLEAFAVQPDGKLVVGGFVVTDPGEGPVHSDFTLMRFTEDGTLDTGFGGGDGKVSIDFGDGNSDSVTALAMQGANIVAAGQTSSGVVAQDAALARLLPDGTLDESFGGGDGKVTASILALRDWVRDLAVLPDGDLMIAGYGTASSRNATPDFIAARFRPDGSPDEGFGGDGKVSTGFARGTDDFATSMAIQGSRAILAGSTRAAEKYSFHRFALVAYKDDGSLARSFGGGDGRLKTVFGADDGRANDLVVTQGDGKLLVVGEQYKFRGPNFALARYSPDGTLDKSFGGGDGKLTTDASPEDENFALAADIDGEGRAVVGGGAAYDSPTDAHPPLGFGLARYLLE